MDVASIEEIVDNGSDTDVDVDDSSSPTAVPHLSSAQLLMQATQAQGKQPSLQHSRPKGKLVAVTAPKSKTIKQSIQTKPTQKQANLMAQAAKQANLVTQVMKQNAAQAVKQVPAKPAPATQPKPTTSGVQQTKPNTPPPKQALISQAAKQAALMAQSAKQASVIAQLTKQTVPKANVIQTKQVNVVKQPSQSPKQLTLTAAVKPTAPQPVIQPTVAKQTTPQPAPKQEPPKVAQIQKPLPTTVPTPSKSPLIKQRPLQKQLEPPQVSVGFIKTTFINLYFLTMDTTSGPRFGDQVQPQDWFVSSRRFFYLFVRSLYQ